VSAQLAESRAGSHFVLRVDGAIDVHGVAILGRRLLATLNDGERRLLLDLSGARPLATGALLGTVLRIDRYARRRDARLVVLAGAATERVFALGDTQGLIAVAQTPAEAETLLGKWSVSDH
jgi:ABC-type hemin transport system substrate-binding protein